MNIFFSFLKIKFPFLFIWIFISLFFPIVGQTMNMIQLFECVFYISISFLIGIFLIENITEFEDISEISKVGLSIFLGFFILSIQLFFNIKFVIGALLLYIFYWISQKSKPKKVILEFRFTIFFLITIFLFLFFYYNKSELIQRGINIHSYKTQNIAYWSDIDYWISIVQSLSKGTLKSSIYEIDSNLNYQFLPFLPSAFLNKYCELNSQVALYGIWSNFVNVLGLILISELLLFWKINNKYIKIIFIFMYFLLQPIHNRYFLMELPQNTMGFLSINYNTNNSTSLIWSMIIIFLILYRNNKNYNSIYGILLIVISFPILILSKIPLFVSLFIFVGYLSFFYYFSKKDYKLFFILLLAFILSIICYVLVFNDSTLKVINIKWGFFLNLISSITNQKSSLILICIYLILTLLWLNFKLLVIIYYVINYKTNKFGISISLLLTSITLFLISNLLEIKSKIPFTDKFHDGTYDVTQFIRSCNFLICLFGTIFILEIILKYKKNINSLVLGVIILVYCSISLIGFISTVKSINYNFIEDKWLDEVRYELFLQNSQSKLLVIDPEMKDEAAQLVSSDVGQFFTSLNWRNYNYSMRNIDRWTMLDSLKNSLNDYNKRNVIRKLKYNHVDLIISTPNDNTIYLKLVKDGYLNRVTNTKWLFKLKD